MLSISIAFFVFGFIDNSIMVLAGDMIDSYLGAWFGISTMFAAGLGNTISDVIGILSGRYVERCVHNYFGKVDTSKMKHWQVVLSEGIGITIGCLFGLLPLLII